MVVGEIFENEHLKCSSFSLLYRVVIANKTINFAEETVNFVVPIESSLNRVIKAFSDLSFLCYKAIKFIIIFLGLQLLAK